MQINFCGCLDKLYLLDPSSSLSFSWKMVSGTNEVIVSCCWCGYNGESANVETIGIYEITRENPSKPIGRIIWWKSTKFE